MIANDNILSSLDYSNILLDSKTNNKPSQIATTNIKLFELYNIDDSMKNDLLTIHCAIWSDDDNWQGATLYYSTDNGESYDFLSFISTESCIGKLVNISNNNNDLTANIIDTTTKIHIIMKKTFFWKGGMYVAAAMFFMSLCPADEVISKEDGMTVINITTLAEDVEGYAGTTPLKIYIKKGKIEKIEGLKNLETPKYWALIKRDLLGKWNGLAVKKAADQKVDIVTGATFSSQAVIENVKRGLDHYNKKGKK